MTDQETALKMERAAALNLSRCGHATSKVHHIKQHPDLLAQLAKATTREDMLAAITEANERDKVADDPIVAAAPEAATVVETSTEPGPGRDDD